MLEILVAYLFQWWISKNYVLCLSVVIYSLRIEQYKGKRNAEFVQIWMPKITAS